MRNEMTRFTALRKLQLGALMLAVSGASMAQASFDTSDLITDIVAAGAALALVAGAIVAGPRLLKAAWGWIRGTVR